MSDFVTGRRMPLYECGACAHQWRRRGVAEPRWWKCPKCGYGETWDPPVLMQSGRASDGTTMFAYAKKWSRADLRKAVAIMLEKNPLTRSRAIARILTVPLPVVKELRDEIIYGVRKKSQRRKVKPKPEPLASVTPQRQMELFA
jgi:hypothetical protein